MLLRNLIAVLLLVSGVSCAIRGPSSFRSANPETRLAELTRSKDDSIAIQAAWRLANLTEAKPDHAEDDEPADRRPDPIKLVSFLDFFEERSGVKPPEWFQQRILGQDDGPPPDLPVATLRQEARALLLRRGNDTTVVPGDLQEKCKDASELTACFTSTYCFVALDCNYTGDYDVFCIDRTTGKTAWASKAEGCWSISRDAARDRRGQLAELVVRDERLVVFGASPTGTLYAHALQSDDGDPLFHFCDYGTCPDCDEAPQTAATR